MDGPKSLDTASRMMQSALLILVVVAVLTISLTTKSFSRIGLLHVHCTILVYNDVLTWQEEDDEASNKS
jgi:hypothetical protein